MKDNKSKKKLLFLFNHKMLMTVVVFLMLNQLTNAQNISAVTDRNKILIGEQVVLQLKAEDINTAKAFIQNWFAVIDSSNHIQIVKREPIDTIDVNGLKSYLQKITLTSFDSGRWKLSPLKILLKDKTTGKETFLQTDSVTLDVLPVNISELKNYHDVKDIIDVQAQTDYTLYVIIAGVVIVLAIITFFIIKKLKNKKPPVAKPVYKGTALQVALQQIKELQQKNNSEAINIKSFYTALTAICREYFEDQLQVRSSQATSDELMILLAVYLQDEKKRTAFYQLLRLSNAVKFAKYLPGQDQNKEAIETAITSLQHIDGLIKQIKQHA